MKKVIVLILLTLLLAGCTGNNNEIQNSNSNNTVSNSTSNSNIEHSNSNDLNGQIDYDKNKVGQNKVNLYLFYSPTCPHCHAEMEWLNSIKEKYEFLNVVEYAASENYELYESVVEKMNINDYHVPLTIIGDSFNIGYSSSKDSYFINLIEYYSTIEHCDMVETIKTGKNIDECKQINKNK